MKQASSLFFASVMCTLFSMGCSSPPIEPGTSPKAQADAGADALAVSPRGPVLYVTIDKTSNEAAHKPNIAGVAASASELGYAVDPLWSGDLRGHIRDGLEGRAPLAVVLSGSFTEWHEARDDRAWLELLDELGDFLKATTVPVLAMCGSHQLVGRTFGSWAQIRHVTGATIQQEMGLASGALIPEPRVGEVGTFPIRALPEAQTDPIFEGLGSSFWITESHFDEVTYDGDLPGKFSLLAEPTPEANPIALVPIAKESRSPAQAMRWRGTDRVLYSVLFHPDLVLHPDFANADSAVREAAITHPTSGPRLLKNFFAIAAAYWMAAARP